MVTRFGILSCLVALAATSAFAQVEAEPDPRGNESNTEFEEASSPALAPGTDQPTGDVVHFKSGSVLTGVQVLRKTLNVLEVRLIEGLSPLKIPLSQVESVTYDDIDPLKKSHSQPGPGAEAAKDIMFAQKVSPEMSAILTSELPASLSSIENRDLVDILAQIERSMKLQFYIGEGVRALPPEERKWTAALAPGATVQTLLQEGLRSAFPNIKVTYQYEKILITLKSADVSALPDEAPAPGAPNQTLPEQGEQESVVAPTSTESPSP